MNFGDEDELDFEEDFPENEPKENEEEEKAEDCNMNEYDQYLQIDCLDDEEDLLSKVALEPEKPKNSIKDTGPNAKDLLKEKNEKSENKREIRQEQNHRKRNFGKIRGKNRKHRPFGTPLNRSPGSLCSYRWRPGNNFMRLTRQNIGQRLNHLKGLPLRYPKLQHFSQNYLQNQNEFVSLLGLGANNNQNLQQMNLFANSMNPILEVSKNFITNGVLGQCGNAIFNQLQYNNFSMFKGALEQKLAADANSKNFPVRCVNGFKTNYNRGNFNGGHCDKERAAGHVLPEGEKELVKSKKEARLLRFMNDQTGRNDRRPTENAVEKPPVESLNLEDEYFRKMEEQKRKRQEIFNLKTKQAHCNEKGTADALVINKELLLRKENPFDGSLKMARSIKFEIKEEKWDENGKENQNGSPVVANLCFVKKEVESPVKFVRTVSKSYEELGLSKAKNGLFSKTNATHSDNINVHKTSSVDAASQTQTEPHLTGCIVKVLNVPPSTTANDVLALCSPFGNVREVKLNFPKENSVAIRFGEPKSAENFFKWYNGRVIDDHTLNVITV